MATSAFPNDTPPAGHDHRAVGARPATGDLLAGVRRTIGQLTGALTSAVPADWHGPAGSLDWSVQRTVDHLVDVCCWYAIQLASGAAHHVTIDAAPPLRSDHRERIDALRAAAALLVTVIGGCPADRHAWHWYGPADPNGFAAMTLDEVLVHGYDITQGLNQPWSPPPELPAAVLTRLFPDTPPGTDPWSTLLWANGRIPLADRPQRTTWRWTT